MQRQLRKSSATPDEGEYRGVLDAFEQIYKKEGGIAAFYSGVLQDTGKSIADSFLFFLFYNYIRTQRLRTHGERARTLPVLDELGVGALAGACSKFFTTPIANIVTRKQIAAMVSSRSGSKSSEPSAAAIASSIRSEKGIQGFWAGYSASLVLTLNPSLTFFLYEFFKKSFLPRSRRDDPGAKLTFLMAAVSKAIASTITYPFSLAKARAQTSSRRSTSAAKTAAADLSDLAEEGNIEKAGQDAEGIARRSTVFSTILTIYRAEGFTALYEGIVGEILKGFFSHGITMIVKETIHKLIIQTYYLLLRALNRYPPPSELAAQAGEAIQDGAGKVGGFFREGYGNVADKIGDLVQEGREAVGNAGEKVSEVTSDISETTGRKVDSARREAGQLQENVRDKLGKKIGDLGKDIKPEK